MMVLSIILSHSQGVGSLRSDDEEKTLRPGLATAIQQEQRSKSLPPMFRW